SPSGAAGRQAGPVIDWVTEARRFLRDWLFGLGRFVLAMVQQGWKLLVLLGVVAGVTLVAVGEVHWTQSKVLAAVVIALLLALNAGARLEVRLRGDLPITVHLEPGNGAAVFLLVDNTLGVP